MQFRHYGSHFTFAVLNCSWLHLLRFPSQTFYHEETEKEIIYFSEVLQHAMVIPPTDTVLPFIHVVLLSQPIFSLGNEVIQNS